MSNTENSHIKVDGFGFLPNDSYEIIQRYTITNKNNASVRLISLGAGIQSITLPNKNNDMADVILGFDNVTGYLKNRYIGRIVGRVSNQFTKKFGNNDKKENTCTFDTVNWNSNVLGKQVVMTYVSHDGSEGYSGNLFTQVKYTWTDDNRLDVNICAMSTKPTPINISNYYLFNLAGHAMGPKELKNHIVTVNADYLTQLDNPNGSPTGVIESVHKTVYDLRTPTQLSSKKLYKIPGGGYNHNLCINSSSSSWCYRFHARMLHPESGRYLEVYSNHPALQLYTGNDLPSLNKNYQLDCTNKKNINNAINTFEERIIGKDGLPYRRHGCFALIPQGYPVTNNENFASNMLYPGKIYTHNITYEFGVVTR